MSPKPRAHQIRVIAGEWRGRKLSVVNAPGLRPTLDRVRETLFNWLVGHTEGARGLDLFAGTGALGIEALSRGAEHMVFVESQRSASQSLEANLAVLGVSSPQRAKVEKMQALSFLERFQGERFDLVFLDPPFDLDILPGVCSLLEENHMLTDDAHVYLEWSRRSLEPAVPEFWLKHRHGQAGDTAYALYKVGRTGP